MTPEHAIQQAKQGHVLPVYLVMGEERFIRDQVLTALKSATLAGGVAGLNEEQFTAGEVDVGRVLDVARTSPMMAKRRWVLVKQAERWDTQEGKGKNTGFDQLASYAERPVESTVLVVVADKLDARRKLVSVAKKQDFLVSCTILNARELPGWIAMEAKRRGHPITHSVADLIAELSGPELASVSDALERLSLYVGPAQPIDSHAVTECVTTIRQASVWELLDAIGRRQLGEALRILSSVFDARDRGLKLLGLLAWSTRQMLRFRVAMGAGASPEEAAKAAGAPPFKARELARQVKGTSEQQLEAWLSSLAEADLALKGGSKRPAKAILEAAVIAFCRRSAH